MECIQGRKENKEVGTICFEPLILTIKQKIRVECFSEFHKKNFTWIQQFDFGSMYI